MASLTVILIALGILVTLGILFAVAITAVGSRGDRE